MQGIDYNILLFSIFLYTYSSYERIRTSQHTLIFNVLYTKHARSVGRSMLQQTFIFNVLYTIARINSKLQHTLIFNVLYTLFYSLGLLRVTTCSYFQCSLYELRLPICYNILLFSMFFILDILFTYLSLFVVPNFL